MIFNELMCCINFECSISQTVHIYSARHMYSSEFCRSKTPARLSRSLHAFTVHNHSYFVLDLFWDLFQNRMAHNSPSEHYDYIFCSGAKLCFNLTLLHNSDLTSSTMVTPIKNTK